MVPSLLSPLTSHSAYTCRWSPEIFGYSVITVEMYDFIQIKVNIKENRSYELRPNLTDVVSRVHIVVNVYN